MNINEKIKKLRERFYLTQEGFGKLLSISEKEIDDLENGVSKPNNKQIKKIEEIFRISLKDSDIDDSVNLMVVEMNDTISFLGFCDNIIDDIYFWWNIDECLRERVNLNQENKLERGTYYILEKDGIHILVTLDGTKAYVELINGSTETSFVVNGFSYSREECCHGVCDYLGVSYKKPNALSYPLLKGGSKGDMVKYLQYKLLSKFYNPGEIDGAFGSKVFDAVKRYQSANNLDVDGIVGPKTWSKLRQVG